MRFTELICFCVILSIFSSILAGALSQIMKMDRELLKLQKQTDSLIFISESFCNSCRNQENQENVGAVLEKWEKICIALWKLERIEWKCTEENEKKFFYAKWKGPYGEGVVFSNGSQ